MEILKNTHTFEASHETIINFATFILKLSGFNFRNDGRTSQFIILFTTLWAVYNITQEVAYLMWIDNKDSIICVSFINTNIMYVLAVIYCRLNWMKFVTILNLEDYSLIDLIDLETQEKNSRIYKNVNILIRVPVCFGYISLAISVVSGVFDSDNFLNTYYNFFDVPVLNQLDFIFTIFKYLCLTSLFIGIQLLLIASLVFIYCQIRMLKNYIVMSDQKQGDENKFYDAIVTHIKNYSKIIKYFESVNATVSVPLLLLFVVQTVTAGIQIYDTIKQFNMNVIDHYYSYYSLADILTFLSFLTVICYAITIVTDEIKSLGDTIYNCNWVSFPSTRVKCAITLIITRAKRGVDFTFGGIINVNMELCTSCYQFLYSLYTLFGAVRK